MGPLTKTFQTTAATTSLLAALLAAGGQNDANAAGAANTESPRPTDIHLVIKDRTITVVSPKEIENLIKASGNDAEVAKAALNKLLEERRATEEERKNARNMLLLVLGLAGAGAMPFYFSAQSARRELAAERKKTSPLG